MQDQHWLRALQAVHELEAQRAPARHRLQTSACPPLARVVTGSQDDWTPEEEKHIVGCRYCQKVRAMAVGQAAQLPLMGRFLELLRQLATNTPLEPSAIRGGEGLTSGERLARAPLIHQLSRALAAGRQSEADVQQWWRRAAMSPPVPLPAAAGHAAAAKTPPFRVRAAAEEAPLVATLRETEDGRLIVHVRTDDASLEGVSIGVNVVGDPGTEPWTGKITLHQAEDGELTGQCELGSISELAQQLGRSCWLLVAPLPAVSDVSTGGSL
jgi:hypothetical protein